MKKLLLVSASAAALLGASAHAETVLAQKGGASLSLGAAFESRAYAKSQKPVFKTAATPGDASATPPVPATPDVYEKGHPYSTFALIQVPTFVAEAKTMMGTFRATYDPTDGVLNTDGAKAYVRYDFEGMFGQLSFNTNDYAAHEYSVGTLNYSLFSHAQYFTYDEATKTLGVVRTVDLFSAQDNNFQYTTPAVFGFKAAVSYQRSEGGVDYANQKGVKLEVADYDKVKPSLASAVVHYDGMFGATALTAALGYSFEDYSAARGRFDPAGDSALDGKMARLNLANFGVKAVYNKSFVADATFSTGTSKKFGAAGHATADGKRKYTGFSASLGYEMPDKFGAGVFVRSVTSKLDKKDPTTKSSDKVSTAELGVTGKYYASEALIVSAGVFRAGAKADANKAKDKAYKEPKATVFGAGIEYDF